MKTPDMRRVSSSHAIRWPTISGAIKAAEPLGALMRDIRAATDMDSHSIAAYVHGYLRSGYIVAAGPKGSQRYYLSQEKADAAAGLRSKTPVSSVLKGKPAHRGSVMLEVEQRLAAAGCDGVSIKDIADPMGCDPGRIRQTICDLRRYGKVFSAGQGPKRRHFTSSEWAEAYSAKLSADEAAQRRSEEERKIKQRERDVAATKQKPQAQRAEVKRTRGEELAKITWVRRQQALELREQKRKEAEARRAAEKAAAAAAKKAKAARALQVVKSASVPKPAPKPVPVEVITPAHVKVQQLEPKGFGRYHVDERSVPSIFGSLTPGSYLPLPSRVGR